MHRRLDATHLATLLPAVAPGRGSATQDPSAGVGNGTLLIAGGAHRDAIFAT
jgi:hypothetical protein